MTSDSINIAMRFTDMATAPMNRAMGMMESSFTRMNTVLGKFRWEMSIVKYALATLGIGYVVGKFNDLMRSMHSVTAMAERMRIAMTTLTGGSKPAGEYAFQWVLDFARETPYQIEGVSRAFVMLLNTGLDPTDKALQAIGEAVAALGGTDEDLFGVAKAISDIGVKGKLSAEEMRQLANRGIPAAQILAEAFNLTSKQVADIGNQSIDVRKALDALFEGMLKRYGGSMKELSRAWSGMFGALQQTLDEIRMAVWESGPFEIMKLALSELLAEIQRMKKDGSLDEWADATGRSILGMMRTVASVMQILGEMWVGIKTIIISIQWVVMRPIQAIADGYAKLLELQARVMEWAGLKGMARDTREAIIGFQEYSINIQGRINDMRSSLSDTAVTVSGVNDRLGEVKGAIDKARSSVVNLKGSTDEGKEAWEKFRQTLKGVGSNVEEVDSKIVNLQKQFADTMTKLGRETALQGLGEGEKAALMLQHSLEDVDQKFGELGSSATMSMKMAVLGLSVAKEAAKKTEEELRALGKAVEDEAKAWEGYEKVISDTDRAYREMLQSYAGWKDEMTFETVIAGMDEANRKVAEQERLIRKLSGEYTHVPVEVIRDIVVAHDTAVEAAERHRKAVDESFQAMERAAESFQDYVANTLLDAMEGRFEDLADNLLKIFKRMLAEMAAAAITQQIFIPIYTRVFGLPSGAGTATQAAGGGLNMPGLGSGFTTSPYLWGTAATTDAATGLPISLGSTGLFGTAGAPAWLGTAMTGLGIAALVAAVAIPVLSKLFEDRPQPEFNATGVTPTSFQGFLGARPSDLLFVTKMNADARESYGADEKAVQLVFNEFVGGLQTTFRDLYNAMPEAIQEAWDSVEGAGAELLMESTRKTTGKAVEGMMKLWLSNFDTYIGQELMRATARAFTPDAELAAQLGDKWVGFLQEIFASYADTLSADELAAKYMEFTTKFYSGLGAIMGYQGADLIADYEALQATPSENFWQAMNRANRELEFLGENLNQLDAEGYADALQRMGILLTEKYQLELEYLGYLKSLQEELLSSLRSQTEGFAWDVMTPEERFLKAQTDREKAWADIFAATTPEEASAATKAYIDATSKVWSLGGELYGEEWQKENLPSFEEAEDLIVGHIEKVFGTGIEALLKEHDKTAAAMEAFIVNMGNMDEAVEKSTEHVREFGDEVEETTVAARGLKEEMIDLAAVVAAVTQRLREEAYMPERGV